jgi:hypothetical protein
MVGISLLDLVTFSPSGVSAPSERSEEVETSLLLSSA